MPYTYPYPRPTVTVDSVILRPTERTIELLLIKRAKEPFSLMSAFPGGFLEITEDPQVGAARELEEETGISGLPLSPLFSCGQIGRDPRGRSITMVFGALVNGDGLNPHGRDDAAEAGWFDLFQPLQMAFDHARVVEGVISSLRWQARSAVIGRHLFPGQFTTTDFKRIHSLIRENTPDSPIDRGLRLGLIRPGSFPDTWETCFPPQTHPDWLPFPW